jgi:hypothetical protein
MKWTGASHLHKAMKKIIGMCSLAQQCSTSYCCPYWKNPSESEIWSSRPCCIQSGPCTFGYPYVWTPRGLSGPSICRCRGEGSGAWLASHSAQPFFPRGLRKLVDHWTKCDQKQGYCHKVITLVTFHTKFSCWEEKYGYVLYHTRNTALIGGPP